MPITAGSKSRYTFSLVGYYDQNCMNFGALRVINDDFVEDRCVLSSKAKSKLAGRPRVNVMV